MTEDTNTSHIEHTAMIVSAYVSNNSVRPDQLPDLIASVRSSLDIASRQAAPPAAAPIPAVPVNKSVFPDHLVSLEDGKSYKSLKRHLGTRGMTPDQYREKWGLPATYPMVCADYSKVRTALAKSTGLGVPAGKRPSLAAVA